MTVLSVNYRSGVGYGAAFRLCEECMGRGAAEYADVRKAASVLVGEGADSARIGIWGLSYGGLNVLQAIARDSGVFSAGVSIAGVFNIASSDRYITDTGNPIYSGDLTPVFRGAGWRGLPTGPLPHLATPTWGAKVHDYLQRSFRSSPVSMAANMTSPLLLIQGDADEEVEFEEMVGCVRALRAFGISPEVSVVPDEVHGLGQYDHQLDAYQATAVFLNKHLK
jgi:dipeptidyl aminopeptidase/acylaminoacyl peptidase